MSTGQAPMFPTPLTIDGRLTWASEQERRADWHLSYSAMAFTSALADGRSPESMSYELDYFRKRRDELAQANLVLAEAREEFYAHLDEKRADQKKMPSAVRAAEGDEKPTNQEGVFNDHFSSLPQGGTRPGVEAGAGEAPPCGGPAAGSRPASGVLRL